MAGSFPSQANPGMYVPTTYNWDVSRIQEVDVNSKEFKELLVRLYQNIAAISQAVNLSDKGYYVLEEFVTGSMYFQDPALNSGTPQTPTYRNVFRKVINFGVLPITGSKSVPHGLTITNTFIFVKIYATASDQVGLLYIPIPFADPTSLNNNISLTVDSTNVTITTGSNRSNFLICFVVLEFIKF